jgi:transposase
MRRYELSDEQWAFVAPLLPACTLGRPRRDDRTTLDGIFWKLCSGAPWRDVPERYGPWQTLYERFTRYRDDGTLDRVLAALQVRLDATGHLDWTTWMVDATIVRASRAAAGARKKGGSRLTRGIRHTSGTTKRSDAAEGG